MVGIILCNITVAETSCNKKIVRLCIDHYDFIKLIPTVLKSDDHRSEIPLCYLILE